jgi:thiol-disulfide isomerase/thioredoxin
MSYTLSAFAFLLSVAAFGQTLSGTLSLHTHQELSLTTFNAYDAVERTTTTVDSLGNFTLAFDTNYTGIALLQTQDQSTLPLLLTPTDIQLKGSHLKARSALTITPALNNQFLHYEEEATLRKRTLSAWDYLLESYQNVPLLSSQSHIQETIIKEQNRIAQEEKLFIESLDPNSYLHWFIGIRQFFYAMVNAAKTPEKHPELIEKFRTTDFTNPNFTSSSLFKKIVELHFQIVRRSGKSNDQINAELNISTQYLIDNLESTPALLNAVATGLFDYFEQQSLFEASAYLSMGLLEDNQCDLNDDLVSKLETYRTLKIGNTAPEIVLDHSKKLSDLKTHKLVVFGASWCPHCTEELPKLENYANTWKANTIELIYMSLDTSKKDFEKTYLDKPWQSYCDFKGWDSQAALDYFVAATPTYFLLDATNKILLRPKSVEHANAWMKSKGLVK